MLPVDQAAELSNCWQQERRSRPRIPISSDAYKLLHSIDLFALPTQYAESKGISAIEALVAGVPVVAPKHGAFPELLDHGQAGLLHTPHDEKDLANTIFTLVADAQLSQLLGAHGHALASRRNSPLAMVSGHDAIYSQVCRRT